ncbi:succinyl-diaminopimelate desuccinylase [Microbispora sp. RL4-1S]|uniref:Succinyl-diaminopimelate desuccinylase n=1 Tax=Microbispora oryzae TaxID=2806554 RepID=A0A940WH55_9ACTN|nr:succinyl-diaminopimelate desuccinylase [Microbispora oryzae]MBP2705470.1 succinyl-diaminopimelate desuccinylase [Microbispora oryzae]
MNAVREAAARRRAVLDSADLVELTRALVGVPSVSGSEGALADLVERRLRTRAPWLRLYRTGNNIVARTEPAPAERRRVVLAGHLDTVPMSDRQAPAPDAPGSVSGLGAVDMKGGVAVMLALAEQEPGEGQGRTFVFYDREETGSHGSGMRVLFEEHRSLVDGDLAVLLEPTNGLVEAGCQGNLVVELTFTGSRAHTARPWKGLNAIHKAAPALHRIAGFTPGTATIDGLEYRQSMSVVAVEGGVQGNVVPDHCVLRVNYRHSPDVDSGAAERLVLGLAPEADAARVRLASPPAPPDLGNPLMAGLCAAASTEVRPKLGWTDVGRFAAHGIPAVNFGPGDSQLAHTPFEVVGRAELEACHTALSAFLRSL